MAAKLGWQATFKLDWKWSVYSFPKLKLTYEQECIYKVATDENLTDR